VIELELLKTALLLGGLILLGGCYGILYGIGKLANSRAMQLAGFACYGLQWVIALMVVGLSPLTTPWKLVVIIGTLGFFAIPPITWRFVERTHEAEGHT
jgi:peptidoglycan/LPS O-acetylase OafA/YrhL